MKELIGKTIKAVYINTDKTALIFKDSDDQNYRYNFEADCCSETWIEHIDNLYNLIGNQVLGFEEVELGNVMPTRQESDELYGIRLKLKWNPFSIEFRNSSNGYYGGSCKFRGNPKTIESMKELKEDF